MFFLWNLFLFGAALMVIIFVPEPRKGLMGFGTRVR